jgi:hypothetical protein
LFPETRLGWVAQLLPQGPILLLEIVNGVALLLTEQARD